MRPCLHGFVCSQLIREELLQKAEVEGQVPLLMEVPGMRKLNVQLPRNAQCAYCCGERAMIVLDFSWDTAEKTWRSFADVSSWARIDQC